MEKTIISFIGWENNQKINVLYRATQHTKILNLKGFFYLPSFPLVAFPEALSSDNVNESNDALLSKSDYGLAQIFLHFYIGTLEKWTFIKTISIVYRGASLEVEILPYSNDLGYFILEKGFSIAASLQFMQKRLEKYDYVCFVGSAETEKETEPVSSSPVIPVNLYLDTPSLPLPRVSGRLPLDAYPEGAIAAFSLRRLRKDYLGPAIKVSRVSDYRELDIYFLESGSLDRENLLGFAREGDGNVFVKTWYNQAVDFRSCGDLVVQNEELLPVIVENNWLLQSRGGGFIYQNGESARDLRFLNLPYIQIKRNSGFVSSGNIQIKGGDKRIAGSVFHRGWANCNYLGFGGTVSPDGFRLFQGTQRSYAGYRRLLSLSLGQDDGIIAGIRQDVNYPISVASYDPIDGFFLSVNGGGETGGREAFGEIDMLQTVEGPLWIGKIPGTIERERRSEWLAFQEVLIWGGKADKLLPQPWEVTIELDSYYGLLDFFAQPIGRYSRK